MNHKLIDTYIRDLDDECQLIRINAINQLGETGDELCLKELRERLKFMSQEHSDLIIAVGKLKKKHEIK